MRINDKIKKSVADNINEDLVLLSSELKKCFTPFSGKGVVCLIQTKNGKYFGHNVELEKPLYFLHAEEMAFAKMLDNEPAPVVEKLVTWGSKSSESFKNVTPCFDCFEKLKLFMDDKTKIEIIHPDITKGVLKLKITDFQNVYRIQPKTEITGTTNQSIVNDLKKKTILSDVDLKLIADIRLFGIRKKITFLLIGSTANKGGTSKVTLDKTKDTYHDIDLLVLTHENDIYIENEILKIIKKYYNSCILTRKECPVPSLNTTRLKRKFLCSSKKLSRLIDLDIGTTLENILHKPEYINRNWFHYLSKGDIEVE